MKTLNQDTLDTVDKFIDMADSTIVEHNRKNRDRVYLSIDIQELYSVLNYLSFHRDKEENKKH